MSKKVRQLASASTRKPASMRTPLPLPKGGRGKPFASGPDMRRNMKGRGKAKAKGDPYQIALAVLVAPVTTITNGRRRKKPRLRAILEQQLAHATNGDQAALRAAATFLRAVNSFRRGPEPGEPANRLAIHDEQVVDRIVDEWEARVAEAASRQGGRKKSKAAK